MTPRSGAGGVGATWARGHGLTLARGEPSDVDTHPGLARALADGIERGYDGPPPAFPASSEWYRVRQARRTIGVLVLGRDCPEPGAAAVLAVAIDPDARGFALATKALLVMERQLAREAVTRWVARVPRTNGRGLYFMLRAGLTPIPPRDDGDATWLARNSRA